MSKPNTTSTDTTACRAPGTLALLHQRELRRLAQLEQQQAALARRIEQQLRRCRMAEQLLAEGGAV